MRESNHYIKKDFKKKAYNGNPFKKIRETEGNQKKRKVTSLKLANRL